jgi:hypothetical protein
MHTEHTLGAMEKATSSISYELQSFRDLAHSAFIVKELPSETSARGRQKQKTNSSLQDAPHRLERRPLWTQTCHHRQRQYRHYHRQKSRSSTYSHISCTHWAIMCTPYACLELLIRTLLKSYVIYHKDRIILTSYPGRTCSSSSQTLLSPD